MAGLEALTPTLPTQDARLYERLSTMEARLRALEGQRDYWITPLTFLATTGSPHTQQITTHGGKLWILHGGTARTGGGGGIARYVVDIPDAGVSSPSNAIITTTANTDYPTGMDVITVTGLDAGTHNVSVTVDASGGFTTTRADAELLVVEFPANTS